MTDTIATVVLPNGETIPKLGLGTWEMGSGRRGARTRSPRCARASSSE